MTILTIKDLPVTDELDRAALAAVRGGRMKLPFQRESISNLLASADGEPVSVYVDGLLVNSLATGYAPR